MPALSRSASEPAGVAIKGLGPVGKWPIRKRAAEIVQLQELIAPSTTGNLQHVHLERVRKVLEKLDPDELELDDEYTPRRTGTRRTRNRDWTEGRLGAEAERLRLMPRAKPEGAAWKLRRGRWVFEGGPEPEKISADEAMKRWREEEEQRGRGPRYSNSVAAPGLMRQYRVRKADGGFFSVS